MSTPDFHPSPDPHKQFVSRPSGEQPARYSVIQGATGFNPAGLPEPAWYVAVNAYGWDDAEQEDFDLNECFELYNQDAEFAVVSGADIEQAKAGLFKCALADAEDHVICDNGGAYAVWALADGRLVLAGFDNGGSDMAQVSVSELASQLGTVELSVGKSHYNPEHALDPEVLVNGERAPLLAEVTRLLQAAPAATKPKGPAP